MNYDDVVEMIFNTPESLCTCWPPSRPENGDIYIFTYQEEKHHFDFVADCMNWRNQGTRLYSKDNLVVKKRYYQRRIGKKPVDFRKCVYEVSSVSRVLIHYTGPRDEDLPEAPHGNRKKQLDRGHIRVMPSVLADIKESKEGVGEIYMKMVADSRVPPQNFKVALPRNIKQVENRKQYDKKQDTVDKCDMAEVDALLIINTELGGFLKYMRIIPCLDVVMINEQLLQEWSDVIGSGERCILSFVTRLRFRDFYISMLIAQCHHFEGNPGIPLAYLIHHRLTVDSYKLLLREVLDLVPAMDGDNVVLVTDKEKAVQDAWALVMHNSHHFTCWDSIKKTVIHRLKKLKVTGFQKKSYLENISNLLLSKSESEYNTLYEDLRQGWADDFIVAFENNVSADVKSSFRGKLLLHGAYTQDSGVTVMESEYANCVLQNLANWNEATLDGVALALYMLSSYCQCELTKGYGNVGGWRLRSGYSTCYREVEELPVSVTEPHDIVAAVQSRYGVNIDDNPQ